MDKKPAVIVIASSSGGTGKTTFAVNVAAVNASEGKKTALIDADTAFGDAALMLNLDPVITMKEAAERNDTTDIRSYCLLHESGIRVLAAPVRPEYAELVKPGFVTEAVQALGTHADTIIVDTAAGLTELNLALFEAADRIMIVTAPGLARAKNTKLLIETLEALHLKDKLTLVYTEQKKTAFIQAKEAKEISGGAAVCPVPDAARALAVSMETGVPLVRTQPKGRYAKAVAKAASHREETPVKPRRKWKWKEERQHEFIRETAVKESES
ncbi:CpaE family protein [Bacillus daqingensis]|uniref:CpaE family protein n=1 Tax=Bacillus daqingensis TaxID=872396 RepID=A0ABV9NXT7_9BACI